MPGRKRGTTNKAPRRFSFSLSEFARDDFGYANLSEACNFLDLPLVREAVKELVEAHRENKAIVAKFPAKVRKAMARLSEIQPRHAELVATQKPGEPPSLELAELNAEVVSLANTIRPHRPITDRLCEANERLCKVLFHTPKAKWREETGRERPGNLSELKRAMAEAGYKPDAVHADGLTPHYAEDYLLGYHDTTNGTDQNGGNSKPGDSAVVWSKARRREDWAGYYSISPTTFDRRRRSSGEDKIRTKKDGKKIKVHVDDLPSGIGL